MPKSGVWPRQKYFAALASVGPDAETRWSTSAVCLKHFAALPSIGPDAESRSSASTVMLATGHVLEQQALYEAAERPIVSVPIRAMLAPPRPRWRAKLNVVPTCE